MFKPYDFSNTATAKGVGVFLRKKHANSFVISYNYTFVACYWKSLHSAANQG